MENLDKAFEYMNELPWLEQYFLNLLSPQKEKGVLVKMLRDTTRYIKIRRVEELPVDSTQTFRYEYPVPIPEVGIEKPVDKLIALCFTAPSIGFRLSKPIKAGIAWESQTVKNCSISARERLTYSGAATVCYKSTASRREDRCLFDYLPSTHSIIDATTSVCERYGGRHWVKGAKDNLYHQGNIEPLGIVVSNMLWSQKFGTMFRIFDVYVPEVQYEGSKYRNPWDMTLFCRSGH